MENEQHRYDLRSSGSRSRSQTPCILQTRVIMETDQSEHHYDLRNRSRERSHTPIERTTPKKASTKLSPSSSGRIHDQSMETITESKEENRIERSESQNEKTEESSPVITKSERITTRQKSRKQIFANGRNESQAHEKTEEMEKNVSPQQIITSDYSSEEGDQESPSNRPPSLAYKIYKEAGNWWSVFPKTGFTYYAQPTHQGYEIAPGVLPMPNMSRRSVHSDSGLASSIGMSVSNLESASQCSPESSGLGSSGVWVQSSAQSKGKVGNDSYASSKETVIRKRHTELHESHREVTCVDNGSPETGRQRQRDAATRFGARQLNVTSYLDSDTELEDSMSTLRVQSRRTWKISWLFTYLTTVIVTWYRKIFGSQQMRRSREYHSSYQYQSYNESIWSKLWKRVDASAQYLYFCVVRIFLFDSWLLSKISTTRQKLQERGSKFGWILMFTPLLLLFGLIVVQMLSFIRLDSLVDFTYNLTETLNRYINDSLSLIYRAYDSFSEYTMNVGCRLHDTIAAANVSLPKMPSFGLHW